MIRQCEEIHKTFSGGHHLSNEHRALEFITRGCYIVIGKSMLKSSQGKVGRGRPRGAELFNVAT